VVQGARGHPHPPLGPPQHWGPSARLRGVSQPLSASVRPPPQLLRCTQTPLLLYYCYCITVTVLLSQYYTLCHCALLLYYCTTVLFSQHWGHFCKPASSHVAPCWLSESTSTEDSTAASFKSILVSVGRNTLSSVLVAFKAQQTQTLPQQQAKCCVWNIEMNMQAL